MKYALKSLLATALVTAGVAGQAAVVQIDGSSSVFVGASPITFGEAALGATNPTIGSVSFGSFFAGQSLGDIFSCGGAVPNCVLGSPTGSLSLAASPPGIAATVVNDPAQGSSPALAGSSDFTLSNPIAMLFAQDVSAVSFVAGGFNNLANTRIAAFSRTGALLAEIFNPPGADPTLPADFFTFAFGSTDASGNPLSSIAGLLISVIGFEDQGFAIDTVRTVVTPPPTSSSTSTSTSTSTSSSTSSSSTSSSSSGSTSSSSGDLTGQVPEPTSLALVGLALLGLGLARLRRA